MDKIFEEQFSSGALPRNWYTDTAFPDYAVGQWNCKRGDGVIITLPHDNWKALRVEVELRYIGKAATAFFGGDTRTSLPIPLGQDYNGSTAKLVFEWTEQTLSAQADGVEVLLLPNPWQTVRTGSFHAGFRDCVVTRIAGFGQAITPLPAPIAALDEKFPLEVTVDFNDDLMAAAWSHQTFDNLFKELKAWGARRVSWIDLGREEDDYFLNAPYGTGRHGIQTFRNVGDIFTAAVQHAHRENLELFGIFKPFDMAIAGFTVPPFSSEAKTNGRIPRIGGSACWASRLAVENQHLVMARKPSASGAAKNKVWTRLDLVKEDGDENALSINDITILVSDDNHAWREYSGPICKSALIEDYPLYRSTPSGPKPTGKTRRSRVFRFDNLHIAQPFFAIEVKGDGRSFANQLMNLVHLFGESGEETHCTFGLTPRRLEGAPRAGGFEFNRYIGSPSSANGSNGDPILLPLALDRGAVSHLAFARGKDTGPLAALSPSFPQTRKLWLTWIEAMLGSGADGIDVRPGHHHADFSWIEYGFEEPVRAAMLERSGVDIWETDEFDYDLWRKIRGQGYTQFLREASALTRSRGKQFVAHIDGYFDAPPGCGGAMNIVADWREWIEEGLLDGISGKGLWPNSYLANEVLTLAHKHRIPVSYIPYCNNFFEDRKSTNHLGDSPEGCEIPVERLIEWAKRSGFDSFGFYECASALRADEIGHVNFRPHAQNLREVMKRHFPA